MEEIDRIQAAIAALEAQRLALGDEVVDLALAPLLERMAALRSAPALGEQRKLVTVLFADLVDFTPLGESMDPEELREIIDAYFRRWSEAIEKRGGVIEKFIGDAVMAVFGLDVSREDDPESAVRAAIDMREQMAGLNRELQGPWGVTLAMRTGIHTGQVVVGSLRERQEQGFIALGDTVNLASRLQTAAPSGGILISHDTYRHVRGVFDVQALEPIRVKGKKDLIQAYLVTAAKRRAFRMLTRGIEGLETRMIGRDAELQRLKEAVLEAIRSRETQVVTIAGEAGIGKSRLIAELDQWAELLPQVIRYFKGRAGPSMQNQPYSLLRDLFSNRFQIYDSDPPRAVQEKIEAGIGELDYGLPAGQAAAGVRVRARAIGLLLGYQLEDRDSDEPGLRDPVTLRSQALVYLKDYFRALANLRPIVLLLEDIHWVDDSSLDALEQLIADLPHLPLVLVCAARPNFFERRQDWMQAFAARGVHTALVSLKPLTLSDNQRLVEEILQRAGTAPPELKELITNSAEGNPFFTEELVKMLIEHGVILTENSEQWRINLANLEGVKIPSTLVEVLQARFDSLSVDERVILQKAAVMGRVFWDEAVRFMEQQAGGTGLQEPQMETLLKRLGSREMIFPNMTTAFESTKEFYFKHALLRDVTYETVLKRLRKVYHEYAAQWLETITQRSQRSEEFAAWIAEHYHLAEDHEQAREWYRRGGAFAASRYANSEALRCLTHCLQMWPEADREGRIDLLLQRAKIYDTLADRPAQKEDLETLDRLVEELRRSETAGEATIKLLSARQSLQWWFYYDSQGDHQATVQAGERVINLAHAAGDMGLEAQGHLLFGASLWRRGDFAHGQRALEKGLVLARQAGERKLQADLLRNLGVTLQYQEHFSEARAHYEAAQRLYEELGDERGASMTANSLGDLLFEQGDLHSAREYFLRALRLKRKIGHRRAEHLTLYNLGLLDVKLGQYGEAQEALEQTLVFFSDTGDTESRADALLGLGNLSRVRGDYANAQHRLAEALAIYRQNGSRLGITEALLGQAQLAADMEDYASGLEISQNAQREAEDLGQKGFQGWAKFWAGQARLGLGQIAEARQDFQQALELLKGFGAQRPVVEAQAGLAAALMADGQLEAAIPLAGEALRHFTGDLEEGNMAGASMIAERLEGMEDPFRSLLACYRVMAAAGDKRAAQLLSSIHSALQERAASLGSEALSQSFLENPPIHRQIILLSKEGAA